MTTDDEPVNWAGRTFGQLTPAEKRRASAQAGNQLAAELTRNADALSAALDQIGTGQRTMTVTINGTGINPYAGLGLRVNPFPQIGRHELDAGERAIASLDGEPVRSAGDIRARLAGFSEEFIAGCIERWQPGRRVSFVITFPDERAAP
jgi:hypothetical protein